jgi:hypothetical protein
MQLASNDPIVLHPLNFVILNRVKDPCISPSFFFSEDRRIYVAVHPHKSQHAVPQFAGLVTDASSSCMLHKIRPSIATEAFHRLSKC